MTVRARPAGAATALGLATVAALVVAAELMIDRGWINELVVPRPSDVLASFPRLVAEEDVVPRVVRTALETAAAAALVAVAGTALGVLLYRRRVWRAALVTWVGAFAAAPLVLVYPLFLVVFGRNSVTIVVIGFLSGLAPAALKTLEGLSATRRVLLDVGRSFGLTPAQQFWKILLPSALPTVFVGLRLGLMFALINIVAVEFLINFGGLGQLVNDLSERYDLPAMYATIGLVVLISAGMFALTERAERWLHHRA